MRIEPSLRHNRHSLQPALRPRSRPQPRRINFLSSTQGSEPPAPAKNDYSGHFVLGGGRPIHPLPGCNPVNVEIKSPVAFWPGGNAAAFEIPARVFAQFLPPFPEFAPFIVGPDRNIPVLPLMEAGAQVMRTTILEPVRRIFTDPSVMFEGWSEVTQGQTLRADSTRRIAIVGEVLTKPGKPLRGTFRNNALVLAPKLAVRGYYTSDDTTAENFTPSDENFLFSYLAKAIITNQEISNKRKAPEDPQAKPGEAVQDQEAFAKDASLFDPDQYLHGTKFLTNLYAQRFLDGSATYRGIDGFIARQDTRVIAIKKFAATWPVFEYHFQVVPGIFSTDMILQCVANSFIYNNRLLDRGYFGRYRLESLGEMEFHFPVLAGDVVAIELQSGGRDVPYTATEITPGSGSWRIHIPDARILLPRTPAELVSGNMDQAAATFHDLTLRLDPDPSA